MAGMVELTELGSALTRWQLSDTPVCAVRLADVHGFGAVPPAQLMLTDGTTAHGHLLGGAADRQAQQLAQQVLDGSAAVRAELQIAQDDAVGAGLACAGTATVYAHLLPTEQAELLAEGLLGGSPVGLLTGAGGVLVAVGHDGERVASQFTAESTQLALAELRRRLRQGRSVTTELDIGGQRAALDLWVPATRLLLVGSGVLEQALRAQAELLGWSVQATTGVAETEQVVATLSAADAMVLLDHDPVFDGALLRCARGPTFPGALGSRHTQADRRQRLVAAGAGETELDGIRGPVGLDLGARTPAETAVSVVAEIIAWRTGRAPSALTASAGRIGA